MTPGEIAAVSRLEPPPEGRLCVQMIGTVTDEVTVRVPKDRSVRHDVLGRTWRWSGADGNGDVVFVDDPSALEERLRDTERVDPGQVVAGGATDDLAASARGDVSLRDSLGIGNPERSIDTPRFPTRGGT